MADETIVADEQTQEIDESNDLDLDEEEVDATISETDEEKELLKQQLAKAEADKEKWEARYKSTKKQEASKPKETKQETKTDEVNLDELVEKKLTAMQAQKDFITKFGEDVFEEVKKIKDKHPTLSLEDAYKISSIASDPASKENPSALSMGGRPNVGDTKHITLDQLVKLPQKEYSVARERIRKGELTLKN